MTAKRQLELYKAGRRELTEAMVAYLYTKLGDGPTWESTEWNQMIRASKENFKRLQNERDNSFERSLMTKETKVTEPESPVAQAYRLGFPQPAETFEQRSAREFPKNIELAIDSQKK